MTPAILFSEIKISRSKPRAMMNVVDAGVSAFVGGKQCAMFECRSCGHNSGWLHGFTTSEIKRGLPCPECNKETSNDHR